MNQSLLIVRSCGECVRVIVIDKLSNFALHAANEKVTKFSATNLLPKPPVSASSTFNPRKPPPHPTTSPTPHQNLTMVHPSTPPSPSQLCSAQILTSAQRKSPSAHASASSTRSRSAAQKRAAKSASTSRRTLTSTRRRRMRPRSEYQTAIPTRTRFSPRLRRPGD